ncbi:MAG: TonB-dependent receptor domain-containing protein [Acidobacteriota bacterium]
MICQSVGRYRMARKPGQAGKGEAVGNAGVSLSRPGAPVIAKGFAARAFQIGRSFSSRHHFQRGSTPLDSKRARGRERKRRPAWQAGAALLTLILGWTIYPALGQTSRGSLRGRITADNPRGQPFRLSGAEVVLSPAPGSNSFSTVSDNDGRYGLVDLPPGSYTLAVSLPGFKTVVAKVEVLPAQTTVEDVRLELEEQHQTIEVFESATRVSQQSAAPPVTLKSPQLISAPVARPKFKEALPLFTGVLRTQDGRVHMKGSVESQSMVVVDSAQTVDPATGSFAIDVPLDAIESLQVHRSPFSAEYGGFLGGLTRIETKAPSDQWRYGLNDFNPSIRGKNGHLTGINKASPRLHFGGPLVPNRLTFSESFRYELVKEPVRGLAWPRDETKTEGINSFTKLQYVLSPAHLLTGSVHVFPQRQQFANLNALLPQSASSDVGQRGFSAAVSDGLALGSGTFINTLFKYTRISSYAHGQGGLDMLVTPSGLDGNYFNTWNRTSNQQQAGLAVQFPKMQRWGEHRFKVGFDLVHRSFDGTSRSRPVLLLREDGSAAGRIDFQQQGARLAAEDTQVAGFVQDHWAYGERFALDLGLRYSGQSLGGRSDFGPRAGLVFSPDGKGETVVRGGIGIFHDRVPLLAGDFTHNPVRVMTLFDPQGSLSGPPVVFRNVCARADSGQPYLARRCSDLGSTPYSLTWRVGLDRRISPSVSLQLGYLASRTHRLFIVDPLRPPGGDPMLLLSNRGSGRYHEYEATVHFRAGDGSQLSVSYLHSRSRGDLNTVSNVFVPFEQPVIRPNVYANKVSDIPSRVTALGTFKLPWQLTLGGTIDLHSGFPYSTVDVLQDYVGAPNTQRFPTYFSLGLKGYKEFHAHFLPRAPKMRLGFYSLNFSNRKNPHDVFNNVTSPYFGRFAGFDKRINGIVLDFLH